MKYNLHNEGDSKCYFTCESGISKNTFPITLSNCLAFSTAQKLLVFMS